MNAIIDRFEENYAILEIEDGTIRSVLKTSLPDDAKEGDVLVLEQPIRIDRSKTAARAKKIKVLMDDLWK